MANPIKLWLCRASRAGLLAGALLVAFGAEHGHAAADPAASDWFTTDQGKVRLIAANSAVGREAVVRLGLEFRLAEGWKIYWRNPGDAGLPPTIDWTGSTNLAAAELAWPAPQRFSAYGLETIGYEGTVVLPITAHLAHPGEALGLHAALQYLTCKEICIPYDAALTLDLPASGISGGAAGASDHAALIDRFAQLVPGDGTAGGLTLAGAALTSGTRPMLELGLAAPAPLVAPDVFVEGPAGLAFGAPRVTPGVDKLHATLSLPVSGDAAAVKSLTAQPLHLTIVDGAHSLETAVIPKPAAPPRDATLLPAMLAVALLGGFILNFMPCVLPVLSIKLLSATAHAGRSRSAIRRAFLASALGVLASFLALAAALMALRAAGLAVGWGMQFQQPVFLTVMIALCAAFASNLAGLFEIPLPPFLAQIASAGERSGWLGDFAGGAFATLLATPCSAPFLGTAIGFALAGDSLDILVIFLALGVGLALPYLAVAALPAIAGLMPRPGRWMLQLRRVLAILLAATALWLISVLAAQTSLAAAFAVAVALLVVALVPRLTAAPALRRAGIAAACMAAIIAPLVIPVPAAMGQADGTLWRRFDPATIDGLVRDGKIVFVDVTADWCINCKVNEHLVLQSDAISRRLSQPEIVAMRADWTRPDQAIGAFLRGFGRYGIPFYAVFGPATPEGQALPEILTGGEVLAALRRAAPNAVKSAGTAPRPGNGG